MVRADRIDGAVLEAAANRGAIRLCAKRRHHAAAGVKKTNVHFGHVRVVNRDVASDWQTFFLGSPHQVNRTCAREPGQMHACAGEPHQFEYAQQPDRLGFGQNPCQPQTRRDLALVRHAFSSEMRIFRAQHHGVAVGGRVLQRAVQHLRINQRRICLRERDAAVAFQLSHLGETHALQPERERAGRKHARATQVFRAVAQHFNQAGLIENRVGVRRADQAGDAARDGRVHFGRQRVLEFIARFAQARAQINQARSHYQAGRINCFSGFEPGWRCANRHNFFTADEDIRPLIQAGPRINHATVVNQDVVHVSSPQRCSSPPCARRYRR